MCRGGTFVVAFTYVSVQAERSGEFGRCLGGKVVRQVNTLLNEVWFIIVKRENITTVAK